MLDLAAYQILFEESGSHTGCRQLDFIGDPISQRRDDRIYNGWPCWIIAELIIAGQFGRHTGSAVVYIAMLDRILIVIRIGIGQKPRVGNDSAIARYARSVVDIACDKGKYARRQVFLVKIVSKNRIGQDDAGIRGQRSLTGEHGIVAVARNNQSWIGTVLAVAARHQLDRCNSGGLARL